MTTIQPTDQPVRWTVTGEDVHIEDVTEVGALTGVNPALAVVSADSEGGYLAALTDAALTFPALPDSGWLEAGRVYDYLGTLVMVRQSHNRTEWPPQDTPALFVVYRPDADDVLDWIAGESVIIGMRRIYEGVAYRCIKAHVIDSPEWTPPATLGVLWEVYTEPGEEPQPWVQPQGAHDAYNKGDRVTHEGWIWESTIDANVWAPGVYGWVQIEPL
jgi:hypothetical protein